MDRARWRVIFRSMNRYLVVPAFRLGLGPLLANPVVGYIVVLETTGRKSGATRHAPVNYAVIDGSIYCLAGWGKGTHWFANLMADPRVRLRLPGGAALGHAEEVTDREEARRAIVRVARNAGVGLFFDGLNPLIATDEEILARNGWMPVVRIRPVGFAPGPSDPGGRQWAWLLLLAAVWLRRRGRRRVLHRA